MHRIDEAGNVGSRFDKGNPATGQRATVLGADWPNAVQEGICVVIERADMALEKGNDEQLYLAIVAIAAGAAGNDDDGSVPTTRQIHAGGIAQGGGTLANDVTISVVKAVAADIVARTDDSKAITAKGIGDAMASGMPSGCTRLAGGWILMTGVASAAANATTIVTLPTSFPNACAFAGCEGGPVGDAGARDNNPFVSGKGTGSFSVWSARDSAVAITWLALGR